jgi:antitoxin component YwqK of YwqJK toxin-antitoxin module
VYKYYSDTGKLKKEENYKNGQLLKIERAAF